MQYVINFRGKDGKDADNFGLHTISTYGGGDAPPAGNGGHGETAHIRLSRIPGEP
jgi:hypothetical protein